MTDWHLYSELKRDFYAKNPDATEKEIHQALLRFEAMASDPETPGTRLQPWRDESGRLSCLRALPPDDTD